MNKNAKRLSAFLAVLMMSSAFAASASAADTSFIKVKNTGAAVIDETPAAVEVAAAIPANDTAALKDTGWVKTGSGILAKTDDTVIGESAKEVFKKKSPGVIKVNKNEKPLYVNGGKYYSKKDAEKELKKFYEENTYDFYMYRGDKRTFCEGAYYVSSDPDVVYYDYRTETLVAKDHGKAEVYVYTQGGVPFFRMDVSVINKPGSTYSTLELIPDKWQLDGAGDTTGFTVVTDKDWDADDFHFTIAHGEEIASISKKTGKLDVTGSGPIVVRVYHKENPNICGEALLYSGKYVSSFYDGYYKYEGGKYFTNYWGHDYDIGDIRDCYVDGWIKSAEGILIPVLKKTEATIDGKETTVVSYEKVSLKELLRDAYGDKDSIYEIIKKYNFFKNKD